MNAIRAVYFQNRTEQKGLNNFGFDIERITEDNFHRKFFKLWSSKQLEDFFELVKNPIYAGAIGQTFNLQKPVFVEMYWNGELKLELVQVVAGNRFLKTDADYSFKINSRIYFLIEKARYLKSLAKPEIITRPEKVINLNKVFNTIEYQIENPIKYATPVLYTGMTD